MDISHSPFGSSISSSNVRFDESGKCATHHESATYLHMRLAHLSITLLLPVILRCLSDTLGTFLMCSRTESRRPKGQNVGINI